MQCTTAHANFLLSRAHLACLDYISLNTKLLSQTTFMICKITFKNDNFVGYSSQMSGKFYDTYIMRLVDFINTTLNKLCNLLKFPYKKKLYK